LRETLRETSGTFGDFVHRTLYDAMYDPQYIQRFSSRFRTLHIVQRPVQCQHPPAGESGDHAALSRW
jgi:hypothetical protein